MIWDLQSRYEFDSVVSENAMNEAFIQLEDVKAAKTKLQPR